MGKLVLTRKLGEKIVINKSITVEILHIRTGQVKLGIVAPPDIVVDREEIFLRKEKNSGAQSISNKDTSQIGG